MAGVAIWASGRPAKSPPGGQCLLLASLLPPLPAPSSRPSSGASPTQGWAGGGLFGSLMSCSTVGISTAHPHTPPAAPAPITPKKGRGGGLPQGQARVVVQLVLICKRQSTIGWESDPLNKPSGPQPYPELDPKAIIKGSGGRDYYRGGAEPPTA